MGALPNVHFIFSYEVDITSNDVCVPVCAACVYATVRAHKSFCVCFAYIINKVGKVLHIYVHTLYEQNLRIDNEI